MPLGLGRSILSRYEAPAAGGDNPYFTMGVDPNSGNGAALQVTNTPIFPTGQRSFSGTFWFNATASNIDSPTSRIFDTQDGSEQDQFTVQISTTYLSVAHVTNSGGVRFATWQPASFSTNYLDGNWHHIAFQTDFSSGGNTYTLYVDGSNTGFTSTPGDGDATSPTWGSYARVLTDENHTTSYRAVNEFGGKLAYFWLDSGDITWSTNISYVYSSGYVDPGTTGTFGGNLSQPDIFMYVDGTPAVAYGGTTGTMSTVTQGSGSITASDTGGPA